MFNHPYGMGVVASALRSNLDEIFDTTPEATSLLLHYDGAHESTTFVDSSTFAHTLSTNGSPIISTAQSRFGGSSYYPGPGSSIEVPHHASLDLVTGDFTLETHVRRSTSASSDVYFVKATGTGFYPFLLAYDAPTGKLLMRAFNTSESLVVDVAASITLPNLTWVHIAMVRHGNLFKLFQAGVKVGEASFSGTLFTSTAPLSIGGYENGTLGANAWLDETRVKKGVALYTDDFTPPAARFADPVII